MANPINKDMVERVRLEIINQVIVREGGYVDSAADSGGKTKYGITQRLARRHGYKGPINELKRDQAVTIYIDEFWTDRHSALAEVSPELTAELFDTSVNLGPTHAAKFLQRSLNVLNRLETDFDDVKVDGKFGSKTVNAVKSYLKTRRKRGEKALLTAVNCLQGAFYINLTEKRRKDEAHLYGWLAHRIKI